MQDQDKQEVTTSELPPKKEKKEKKIEDSVCYKKEFQYKHRNPYHDRLSEFSDFVMRDNDCEVYQGKWNQEVFKNDLPIHLEIGSGYGHFMHSQCLRDDINFVGIDYRFKRSYGVAKKLSEIPHRNFRYLRAKGERIEFMFNEGEVDSIYFFFPDPWPKARHHKKRLFQAPFLSACHKLLKKNGGRLFIKTDHDGYAEWMKEEIEKDPRFNVEMATFDLYKEHPKHFLASFQTKFEKIFIKQGINIKAFVLQSK